MSGFAFLSSGEGVWVCPRSRSVVRIVIETRGLLSPVHGLFTDYLSLQTYASGRERGLESFVNNRPAVEVAIETVKFSIQSNHLSMPIA